jgi:hypothetical protein
MTYFRFSWHVSAVEMRSVPKSARYQVSWRSVFVRFLCPSMVAFFQIPSCVSHGHVTPFSVNDISRGYGIITKQTNRFTLELLGFPTLSIIRHSKKTREYNVSETGETDPVSRNTVFCSFQNSGPWKMSGNPVTLSVIIHRQNLSESTQTHSVHSSFFIAWKVKKHRNVIWRQ